MRFNKQLQILVDSKEKVHSSIMQYSLRFHSENTIKENNNKVRKMSDERGVYSSRERREKRKVKKESIIMRVRSGYPMRQRWKRYPGIGTDYDNLKTGGPRKGSLPRATFT